MRPFRFIHAADLHLESPFRGLTDVPGTLRERIKESTFTALGRLIELATQAEADFIVISGDVYDAKDRSLRAQLRFQAALETLAGKGIPVLMIHGNHDPLHDGYSAKLRLPERVTVFGSETVESKVLVSRQDGEPLARVSGISFGQAAVTDNLTPGFRHWGDGLYHIGLLHTNVDGDAGHDNYAPCSLGDLSGRGVDYWALGHVHTRRVLRETPWAVYPGNIQGRHIRERGPRGCCVVTVDASGGTSVAFEALDDVRFAEKDISIEGLGAEQELKEALEEAVWQLQVEAEDRAVLARLILTGRGPLHQVLRRNGAAGELVSELNKTGGDAVWIESLVIRTGAPVDREELAAQKGFLGDLLRLASEASATDEAVSAFAEEALHALTVHPRLASLLQGVSVQELGEWLDEAAEKAIDALAGNGDGETGGKD